VPQEAFARVVDDVTVTVAEVAPLRDAAAQVVLQVASILGLDRHDLVVLVLVEDSHDVLNIETLPGIVEKLGEVAVGL